MLFKKCFVNLHQPKRLYFIIFLIFLNLDPPTVRVEKTNLDNLEDKKSPATLKCIVDSNPNSTVIWKKEGMDGIFSNEYEVVFSPVTQHTAGTYTCTAENPLGMSKPAFVDIDVKCKYN